MRELLKGKLIRVHLSADFYDLGRIVYDCRGCDDVIYIPLPTKKRGSKNRGERRLLAPKKLKRIQIPDRKSVV